jgi:hypothetical protein
MQSFWNMRWSWPSSRSAGRAICRFVCRHATRDYLFKYPGHALVVLAHDRPVFSCRGCDQFVQLAVGRIQFGVCLFDGSDQVAHSLGGGASRRGDFFHLSLDPEKLVRACAIFCVLRTATRLFISSEKSKADRRCQNRGVTLPPGSAWGDVLRLPKRHPACRRRETQSGSCRERENLASDAKRKGTASTVRMIFQRYAERGSLRYAGATGMMGRQQDDQAKLYYEFSRRPNSTGLLPQRTHCYVRRPVDLATCRRA